MVSRIIKSKGIFEYLECAREIVNEGHQIKFLLVGPLESEFGNISQSSIDEYADVCSYLGFRDDVSSLISLSHIIVLPSYYKEGVPRVLIEGASLSKPLIATNVNGCRDIVVDKYNGIIIPVKDSKALVNGVLELSKKTRTS